jgi:hypothetical protein
VSQSSEFCHYDPLCCFSTSNTKGKLIFRYRLSPETFGYSLVIYIRQKKVTQEKIRRLSNRIQISMETDCSEEHLRGGNMHVVTSLSGATDALRLTKQKT